MVDWRFFSQIPSAAEGNSAANTVQSTGNGCEDVCHSIWPHRNAPQFGNISSTADFFHAITRDGRIPRVRQMAPLPHSPQVNNFLSNCWRVFWLIPFCRQVPQFKVRSNPLAHRHSHDCTAQVGCRHRLGAYCREFLRMEVVYARPVQPTLLQPLI